MKRENIEDVVTDLIKDLTAKFEKMGEEGVSVLSLKDSSRGYEISHGVIVRRGKDSVSCRLDKAYEKRTRRWDDYVEIPGMWTLKVPGVWSWDTSCGFNGGYSIVKDKTLKTLESKQGNFNITTVAKAILLSMEMKKGEQARIEKEVNLQDTLVSQAAKLYDEFPDQAKLLDISSGEKGLKVKKSFDFEQLRAILSCLKENLK